MIVKPLITCAIIMSKELDTSYDLQPLKVCPHGRTVSVRQTLLPCDKAKEVDVISVETREVDMVTNSGTR